MKQYSFSVVIPNYNEENYIKPCIESILNQSYNKELVEIIIVDGNSSDNSLRIIEVLQAENPNIKLLSNPEKLTPKSLNIGIKGAKGDFIIILGAHTRLDKNFIKYNNQFINEKNVLVSGGTQINVGKTFTQKLIGLVMENPFSMASAAYRWSRKEKFVDTVVYAAYKKELFDEIGLFEEEFTISEDAEINWRIRKAGYKIFYSPRIKSYYYPRDSVKKFIHQMFRYGILRVNVLKKHLDALKIKHLIPSAFTLVLFLLAIAGFFQIPFWITLLTLIFIHFILSISFSINKLKTNQYKFLPFIPIITLLMHIAWGTGFIVGALSPKSKKY